MILAPGTPISICDEAQGLRKYFGDDLWEKDGGYTRLMSHIITCKSCAFAFPACETNETRIEREVQTRVKGQLEVIVKEVNKELNTEYQRIYAEGVKDGRRGRAVRVSPDVPEFNLHNYVNVIIWKQMMK